MAAIGRTEACARLAGCGRFRSAFSSTLMPIWVAQSYTSDRGHRSSPMPAQQWYEAASGFRFSRFRPDRLFVGSFQLRVQRRKLTCLECAPFLQRRIEHAAQLGVAIARIG